MNCCQIKTASILSAALTSTAVYEDPAIKLLSLWTSRSSKLFWIPPISCCRLVKSKIDSFFLAWYAELSTLTDFTTLKCWSRHYPFCLNPLSLPSLLKPSIHVHSCNPHESRQKGTRSLSSLQPSAQSPTPVLLRKMIMLTMRRMITLHKRSLITAPVLLQLTTVLCWYGCNSAVFKRVTQ